MSDDTPTQRLDAAGDAPTERIATPSQEVVEERKSRRLMITLGIVGGLLLIAVLIFLILLLTKGDGTPTALPTTGASPTASASPTATPTTTATPTPTPTPTATEAPPPPPSNDVEITGFSAATTSTCSSQTGNPVYLDISWSSDNGIAAYFGVNTNDAQTGGMGWTLPPSGNQNDFPNGYVPYEFQCGNASQKYTITIVGTNGSKQSKTVKVTNTGDVF